MYIAPVFTALEYAAFAAFGVGVRQARLGRGLGVLSVWLWRWARPRRGAAGGAGGRVRCSRANYV